MLSHGLADDMPFDSTDLESALPCGHLISCLVEICDWPVGGPFTALRA